MILIFSYSVRQREPPIQIQPSTHLSTTTKPLLEGKQSISEQHGMQIVRNRQINIYLSYYRNASQIARMFFFLQKFPPTTGSKKKRYISPIPNLYFCLVTYKMVK